MMPRNAPSLADTANPQVTGPRRFPGSAFAALDLGTNNCRMLVAAPAADGFRVLDSFSRIVRLGEGLHHTGRLSPVAMERALAALHACAARLARRPVRRLRAIATEACRRAANGAEFLARVKHETGFDIGIISSREEAELAMESCSPLLADGGRRALLFDIGGGSTELAWVRIDPRGRAAADRLCLPAARRGDTGRAVRRRRFDPDGFHAMVDDVADRLARFDRSIASAGRSAPAAYSCSAPAAPSPLWPAWPGPAALSPAADRWHGAEQRGRRRGAGRPARAGPGRAGGASLCRPRPGRLRAAGLRGVRRHLAAVAGP